GQHAEVHGRVGIVGRQLDTGDRDHAHARVLDFGAHQLGELVVHLFGDPHAAAHAARSMSRHDARRPPHSVRATSLISNTSSWSPSLMSLKFFSDRPHSKPSRTSRTSSLKRLSES